jgi:hypothetical protein
MTNLLPTLAYARYCRGSERSVIHAHPLHRVGFDVHAGKTTTWSTVVPRSPRTLNIQLEPHCSSDLIVAVA